MIISLISFTVFILLITLTLFYLIWINKRQKLEQESYKLNQLMQTHYKQTLQILAELEPMMQNDKAFFNELQNYVKEHYQNTNTLGDINGLEAKEFYSFLLYMERDNTKNIKTLGSPIVQRLKQMKLSLMKARESFAYADNEYKCITSSFPINIIAKVLEDKRTKNSILTELK